MTSTRSTICIANPIGVQALSPLELTRTQGDRVQASKGQDILRPQFSFLVELRIQLMLYGGLEARSHLSPSVPCTVGWYHDFDQPIEYPITQNKENTNASYLVLALS